MCIHFETVFFIKKNRIIAICYFYIDITNAKLFKPVQRPIHQLSSVSVSSVVF